MSFWCNNKAILIRIIVVLNVFFIDKGVTHKISIHKNCELYMYKNFISVKAHVWNVTRPATWGRGAPWCSAQPRRTPASSRVSDKKYNIANLCPQSQILKPPNQGTVTKMLFRW